MKKMKILFAAMVLGCVYALTGRRVFANAVVPGTVSAHPDTVTRRLEAAFGTRHLLARKGTANDQLLVGTAAARPAGTVATTGGIGDRVDLSLLGSAARETRVMVASGAIGAEVHVYTAADGKVQPEPAAPGTYWLVGQSRSAADGNNDELEVDTCVPIKVVVLAAFSGTAATDIAALGTALEGGPVMVKVLGA